MGKHFNVFFNILKKASWLLLVILTLLTVLQVPLVKKRLIHWAVEKVLNEPHHQIEIEQVSGLFPINTQISKITFYDRNKQWLQIQDFDFAVNPFQLLFGSADVIGRLNVKKISWDVIPQLINPTNIKISDVIQVISTLPVQLESFEIGEKVLGETIQLTVQNKISQIQNKRSLVIDIHRIDHHKTDSLLLSLLFDANNVGEVSLTFDEKAGGLLGRMLPFLASAGDIKGDLKGSGSMKRGEGDLTLDLSNIGKFKVDVHNSDSKFNVAILGPKVDLQTTFSIMKQSKDIVLLEVHDIMTRTQMGDIKSQGQVEFLPDSNLFKFSFIKGTIANSATFSGDFKYAGSNQKITGNMNVLAPNLSALLGSHLEGSAIFTTKVEGNIDNLKLHSHLKIDKPKIYNVQLKEIDLTAHADSGFSNFDLTFNASDDHKKLTGKATLHNKNGEEILFENLTVEGPGLHLAATGGYAFKNQIFKGDVKANIPNVENYQDWFSPLKNGSLNLDASFENFTLFSDQGSVKGKIEGKSLAFSWGKAGKIVGTFLISPDLSGNIQLKTEVLKVEHISISDSTFDVKLEKGNINYILKELQSKDKKKGEMSINSTGRFDFFKKQGRIDEVKIKYRKINIALEKPIIWSVSQCLDSSFSLIVNQGRVESDKICWPGNGWNGNIKLKKIPIVLLQLFDATLAFNGDVDGDLILSGSGIYPEVQISLEGKKLQLFKELKEGREEMKGAFPRIDCSAKAHWQSSSLTWQIDLQGHKQLSLQSNGKLELFEFLPKSNSGISAVAVGQGKVEALAAFLASGDRLTGNFNLDLQVKGDLSSPRVTGNANLKSGFYENFDFGTILQDIDFEGVAEGSIFRITHFSAMDGSEESVRKTEKKRGYASGEGNIHFKTLLTPDIDMWLKLEAFKVVQNDALSIVADGTLFIKGSGLSSMIQGNIILSDAEIYLDEISTNDIASIKIVEKDAKKKTKKEKKAEEIEHDKSMIFPLSLNLSAPSQLYIHGRGIDSFWKGQMQVEGVINHPYLAGEISISRGNLDFLGKALKITEGKIIYDMLEPNDPLLAITASRSADDITIIIQIEGRSSNPRIIFSSSPSLQQEEILSRLLFGKDLGKISVGQSLQLASAAATLNGQKGINVMDKIRTAFGFDSLELKQNESKHNIESDTSTQSMGQSLSVGKQLNEKVYFSVDQGTSSGSSKASVEIQIAPQVNIEADVGGDKSSGVGLNWVKRY